MMANKDDINNVSDAMDAPTPLEEAMDAPTPMDDIEEVEGEDVQNDTEIDGRFFDLNFAFNSEKLLRKGENGHADIYLGSSLGTPKEKTILKLYQPGRKPKNEDVFFYMKSAFTYQVRGFHFVPLYDYGWYEDEETGQMRYYELLEYMEGGSLDGLPSNTDFNTLKTIVASAARALYFLQFVFGIKHGDVKMSNLFLSTKEDGVVFLGDYDTLEYVGGDTVFCDGYNTDWQQLQEMTRRFDVAKDPKFQSYINDIKNIIENEETPILSYEDILKYAKGEAEKMVRTKGYDFDSASLFRLLEEGGYQEQYDWVNDCFKGNGGCAPYSNFTAAWKAVYGLLGEDDPPHYWWYTNLQDVLQSFKDTNRNWALEELHNGRLKDWLAIFFHKNPWKDFSQQYTYEHEVEKYLEFIRELDPDDENVVRLDAARDSILSGTKSFTNWKWGIWLTQGVCALLYAIPALLLMGWLIFHGMPFDANPMTPTFATGSLAVGAIIAVTLFFIFNNDTFSSGCGCIVSAFVGAVIMLLLMWGLVNIMDSILLFIPWVVIVLMLGLSFVVYCMIFSDDLKGTSVNPQSDPDMWLVQPLYYAFDTSQQGYIYRQASDYDNLSSQYRSGLKKMVLMMVIPILIAWGLWLGYKSITPDLGGTKLTTVQDRLDNMAGDWTGTFGEKKATMQVLCTHRDSFKIALTVEAQQPVTQTFIGKLDGLLDVDLENDTPDDDILDGSVELSINYKSDSVLYGKFRDNLTEKKTNISFKKEKEENDSVQ